MSASPDPHQELLRGTWGSPAPRPTNLVRVFLSSAPTDMAAEREALMETAYPAVLTFCQKHGLMFEVIDLRWGAQDDTRHATTQLLLEEIRRCGALSIGPSFVALLGSQYGPRPAPWAIGEEEFEALRNQLLGEPHTLQLLAQWYPKDENATPPVYALQLPAQASPGQEQGLVSALQRASREAEKRGLISREQRDLLHRSETHREIEAGLFGTAGERDLGAIVFFREVEEPAPDGESAQPGEGGSNSPPPGSEDEQMLADLKARIASLHPDQLKMHRVPRHVDLEGFRHKPQPKYLKELCDQFIAAINHRVLGSQRAHESSLGKPPGLFRELAHHAALSRERAQAPCWRQRLLHRLCQRVKEGDGQAHAPLVVRGPPGCGKTVLLCHLARAVGATLGCETVVVLRLLGTSQLSSCRDSLLHSVCLQACLALGLPPPPPPPPGASSAVLLFHSLLRAASLWGTQPLVLILDSVERLCGPRDAHGVFWLPWVCPPKVHLIVSTLPAEGGAVGEGEAAPEDRFEMEPLSREQAREVLAEHLASAGRMVTPAQQAIFEQSFAAGGHALPVALAVAQAGRWASHSPLSALVISAAAPEAAHRLCGQLEQAHGSVLVGHALGYLACARYGLSEAELKDVLSLDNEVLSELYRVRPPPSKTLLRFPPWLWAQVRHDLAPWLEERWADGFLLLGFLHRDFLAVVMQRYLSAPEERAKRHLLLGDFFRGTWSCGMKKPIELPSSSKPVSLDRKVTPQPLWFSSTSANQRKLSELPFHLLHAGRTEELKRDVLGNMNWIACRVVATGVGSLLSDFALCLAHTSCPELRLLRDALRLLEPVLGGTEGPAELSVVYTEMLARLHSLVPSYPGVVGSLCQQCEGWFGSWPQPVLAPLCGFLHPPGGPLRRTLTGVPKGTTVLELNLDQRVLLAGSLDGFITVWDTGDFALRHVLTGHSAEVKCVKVFGKGTRAASVALDHTLHLWSLATGRQELSIQDVHAAEGQPWCQLHIDEKNQIVYWASGSEVEAWRLETGMPAFRIPTEPPGGWLCAAVFVPRLVLVTASERGALCLWDSISGRLGSKRELLGLGEEAPSCCALLHKLGRMVLGFTGGCLLMISSDGNSLAEKLPEGIRFTVPSRDESLLATGFGQRVRVFLADLTGFRRLLSSDLAHSGEVHAAAISADNAMLFTSSQECIWVWSLTKQGVLTDVLGDTGTPITHLVLWDSTLVSASRHAPHLRVWDLGYDRKHKRLPPYMAGTGCTALSHDAKYVYFPPASHSCNVVIWDGVVGEECDTLDTSAPVRCLEVAERRNLLFVGLASGTVLVFPLDSRQDVGCIPPAESQKPINSLALTQEEAQLAVACDDLVQVFNVDQGELGPLIDQPVYTFYTQLPGAVISSLALLAGHRVLYGMTNGELFLYSCPLAQVFPLELHSSAITCLKTSHGEKWAVSGSADSLRCLWDVDLCCWEHEMFFVKQESFSQGVACACFSKDDRYLFTASLDQCITVWDVAQGTLLAAQLVHTSITRIVPTGEGFVATTRVGYLIRERFRCPQPISPRYNPLSSVNATCRVKSRGREEKGPGGQPGNHRAPSDRHIQTVKLSQICRIV